MNRLKIYYLNDELKSDDRGWAFFPFQALRENVSPSCNLESLHVVKTEPGAVRGNHYHPHSTEWLHIYGGACTLFWEENGGVRSEELHGDGCLVRIPAGIAHSLKNTGDKPIYLVAFREGEEGSSHTEPARII